MSCLFLLIISNSFVSICCVLWPFPVKTALREIHWAELFLECCGSCSVCEKQLKMIVNCYSLDEKLINTRRGLWMLPPARQSAGLGSGLAAVAHMVDHGLGPWTLWSVLGLGVMSSPANAGICKQLWLVTSLSADDFFCNCFDRSKILLFQLSWSWWLPGQRRYCHCFTGWTIFVSPGDSDLMCLFALLVCDRRFTWAIFGVTSMQEISRALLVFVWRWQAGLLQVGAHLGCFCLSLLFHLNSSLHSHPHVLTEGTHWVFPSFLGQWKDTSKCCLLAWTLKWVSQCWILFFSASN